MGPGRSDGCCVRVVDVAISGWLVMTSTWPKCLALEKRKLFIGEALSHFGGCLGQSTFQKPRSFYMQLFHLWSGWLAKDWSKASSQSKCGETAGLQSQTRDCFRDWSKNVLVYGVTDLAVGSF
ncbi:hypothetical protein TIFTF001_029428 [Ficus carica]|uniref:Uncharacterized protein n=1 Tax=Ficus carica TaxID=3494 RepID=A0AA88DRH2_FICCA|nr:hypothetical protein TIFTF001_029428 [Ficus carica]